LENNEIAGIKEKSYFIYWWSSGRRKERTEELKLFKERFKKGYINGGVILYNIDKAKEKYLKYNEIYKKIGLPIFRDQDLTNFTYNNIKYINSRFNRYVTKYQYFFFHPLRILQKKTIVFHMIGRFKIWSVNKILYSFYPYKRRYVRFSKISQEFYTKDDFSYKPK
jgi:hypothetical protein